MSVKLEMFFLLVYVWGIVFLAHHEAWFCLKPWHGQTGWQVFARQEVSVLVIACVLLDQTHSRTKMAQVFQWFAVWSPNISRCACSWCCFPIGLAIKIGSSLVAIQLQLTCEHSREMR